MANVLIAGARGYVGSNLMLLLGAEYKCWGLAREADPGCKIFSTHEPLPADLKFDVVIDLMGPNELALSGAEVDQLDKKVSEKCESILRWAHPRTHFIYASSLRLYDDESVAHVSPHLEACSKTPYSLWHRKTEEYYLRALTQSSLTIGRMGNVFGGTLQSQLGRKTLVPTVFLLQAFNDKKIVMNSDGKQTRDFISIDHLAREILHLIKKGREPLVHLCSGTSMSIGSVANVVKHEFEQGGKMIEIQVGPAQKYNHKTYTPLIAESDVELQLKEVVRKWLKTYAA